ncbi:MAG: hypothetical protein NTU61_05190 [Candidatus Altiarchaeota archaeon]|nr:hypothetical protein [Candidatus Altiarchaeota archaeon]
MAEKSEKKKAKEPAKKRDGGVKVKKTKSGEKIVKEKKDKVAEDVKHAEKKEEVSGKPVEEPKEKPEKKVEKVRKEKPIVKIQYSAVGQLKVSRKKKPRFRRDELYKCKKLKDVWRSPRGLDGKKKEEKRGKGALPKIGYKNPAGFYGIVKGFKSVIVSNLKEIEAVNPTERAAIISASVGRKKRNAIIEEANKRKITILNPRKGEV